MSEWPPIEVRYPWVAVVLRLAQKHAPQVLAELAAELERLGFATSPRFPVLELSLIAPVFAIDLETPNRSLELAKRWLALSREERFAHVVSPEVGGMGYLQVHALADTLCELVRTAVQTGEIILVEGPEAAMVELQLADLQIFRAMRIEFREDRAPAQPADRGKEAEVETASEQASPQLGEMPDPSTTQAAAAPVRAQATEIRDVLDELYDSAVIAAGFKPPALREAGQRGKRVLAERDRYAPAYRIEKIARDDQRHVRRERGERSKH